MTRVEIRELITLGLEFVQRVALNLLEAEEPRRDLAVGNELLGHRARALTVVRSIFDEEEDAEVEAETEAGRAGAADTLPALAVEAWSFSFRRCFSSSIRHALIALNRKITFFQPPRDLAIRSRPGPFLVKYATDTRTPSLRNSTGVEAPFLGGSRAASTVSAVTSLVPFSTWWMFRTPNVWNVGVKPRMGVSAKVLGVTLSRRMRAPNRQSWNVLLLLVFVLVLVLVLLLVGLLLGGLALLGHGLR